jgi:hypothetical protein
MAEYGQLPGQQFYLELTIKGVKYNPLNISYLIIREWIFNVLPYIEIMFADNGFLMETFPLEDGEDIQITLGKNEDDENPLRLTFSLNDYSVALAGDNRRSFVSLNGFLKATDMFMIRTRSFSSYLKGDFYENDRVFNIRMYFIIELCCFWMYEERGCSHKDRGYRGYG